MISRRPLFLDRDGVINFDLKPYVTTAEQIQMIPGSAEAMADLFRNGYDLYVVSNQGGVGRGHIDAGELPRMTGRIEDALRPFGARLAAVEYAVSASNEDPDRKPNPGMIFRHRDRFGLDLTGAFLIGDRETDMAAARNAGIHPVLVRTGSTAPGSVLDWSHPPEQDFPDLHAAAQWILGRG